MMEVHKVTRLKKYMYLTQCKKVHKYKIYNSITPNTKPSQPKRSNVDAKKDGVWYVVCKIKYG